MNGQVVPTALLADSGQTVMATTLPSPPPRWAPFHRLSGCSFYKGLLLISPVVRSLCSLLNFLASPALWVPKREICTHLLSFGYSFCCSRKKISVKNDLWGEGEGVILAHSSRVQFTQQELEETAGHFASAILKWWALTFSFLYSPSTQPKEWCHSQWAGPPRLLSQKHAERTVFHGDSSSHQVDNWD